MAYRRGLKTLHRQHALDASMQSQDDRELEHALAQLPLEQRLKLTFEYFDPDDDDVDEDQQNRFSLIYELAPIEFLQLRAGARVYDGIPQNALQNR
ncbi:MAG: hypothetical protein ACT4O5_04225, partial [Gammaproteobacteria bacterium]